jgi:hypothetical protein
MSSKLEKTLKLTFLGLVKLMAFVGQYLHTGHFFDHGKDVWCIVTTLLG